MDYYFMDNSGQRTGPLSLDELKQRKPDKNTMIWREGMNDWQAAATFPELRTNPLFSIPVLLIYAAAASVVFSLVAMFLYPFIAFLFSTQITYVAAIICAAVGVALLIALFIKKLRAAWLKILLLLAPVLIASLVSLVRYYDTGTYNRWGPGNGYCYANKAGKIGVLNMFGIEIVPCEYDIITILKAKWDDGIYYTKRTFNYAYYEKYNTFNYEEWNTMDVGCFQVGVIVREKDGISVIFSLFAPDGNILYPNKYKITLLNSINSFPDLGARDSAESVVVFGYNSIGDGLHHIFPLKRCTDTKREYNIVETY
ncbi:MAG: DUF4339 domain-containing protein [Prevotellaceae bacterium]|jgi:hypothetical protein|nr:DUF4339 domain-containing protein [Prevotellaceae bacterium]